MIHIISLELFLFNFQKQKENFLRLLGNIFFLLQKNYIERCVLSLYVATQFLLFLFLLFKVHIK